jgi:hypothetical protein
LSLCLVVTKSEVLPVTLLTRNLFCKQHTHTKHTVCASYVDEHSRAVELFVLRTWTRLTKQVELCGFHNRSKKEQGCYASHCFRALLPLILGLLIITTMSQVQALILPFVPSFFLTSLSPLPPFRPWAVWPGVRGSGGG